MEKILVSTASIGSPLRSEWVNQKSLKYEIVFNRIDESTDTARPAAMHPRLCAKMPKMLAWEQNPGYDYYIWADAYFSILDPTAIERLVDYCQDAGGDAWFCEHSCRTSVRAEAQICIDNVKKGDSHCTSRYGGEKMQEQFDNYTKDKSWKDEFLLELGMFVYSGRLVENKNYNVMKEWFYHNCIWSVQDQLSLPYLLHKFKVDYKILRTPEGHRISVYDNDYTDWTGGSF